MPEIVSEIVELSVFSQKSNQIKYLLLRRSKHKNPYPGIWQFITGNVKKNESCLKAALRELKEETNLDPLGIWLVPYVLQFYDTSTDRIHFSPLFIAEVDSRARLRISDEHDKYDWFTYEEAVSRLVWPAQRDGLKVARDYIISGKKVSRLTRLI